MADLKTTLEQKIPQWRSEMGALLQNHRDTVVSHVTLEQLYKGLRGVNAIICDTSFVDPRDGLYIRGMPVLDIADRTGEEIFFLLCTGDLPDEEAHRDLRDNLEQRAEVPGYVWDVIDTVPEDTHPMVLLSMAMLAMQRESEFLKAYNEGMPRSEYWEPTLEDALNIIARIPIIAAGIYRKKVRHSKAIPPQSGLGLSDNFAHMLGLENTDGHFSTFMRKFVVTHSDHEGANASVLASRVVNSTLSDLYYSISGAMNCLAGPLHGLANQESLRFAYKIEQHFGGIPEDEALIDFIQSHLDSGKVIPGFGHAVLRYEDPRYIALYDFGKSICRDTSLFLIVEKLGQVVPPLLKAQGKAKNPYPNIDGITGAMLYHFGMRELRYYTCMFSTAQILGICAQVIMNRAINSPIIRPRSVTTNWLESFVTDAI